MERESHIGSVAAQVGSPSAKRSPSGQAEGRRSGSWLARRLLPPEEFQPALDRFSAFSDGVFANRHHPARPELPVPPPAEPLLEAPAGYWPHFLSYLISFSSISGVWLTHSG